MLVLLIAAALFLLLRPTHDPERRPSAAVGPAAALAVVAGAYDGFFGPGTGTLLIVGLVGLLALPLQQASAEAKVINFASNLAGMLVFAARGTVVWHTALPMAAGQVLGGWLGAHLTVRGGEPIVRWVVLCVVAALVLKLSLDVLRP